MRSTILLGSLALGLLAAANCTSSVSNTPRPEGAGGGAATSVTTSSTGAGIGAGDSSASSGAGAGGGAVACSGALCSDPLNCGAQGHSCLGGSCSGGVCQPILLAQSTPMMQHLALNDATVFASLLVAVNAGDPCAGLARIAGVDRTTAAQATVVACGAAPGTGENVQAMALLGDQVYWNTGDDPNDAVWEELYHVSAQQGGTPIPVGDGNEADQFAIDTTGIYYAKHTEGVFHINLDGTGKTQLSSDFAQDLAVDDANLYLGEAPCALEGDGCDTPASIYSMPKAGGAKTKIVDATPATWGMIARDGYVYWTDCCQQGGNAVYRVATSGGSTETIATEAVEGIVGLAVDATRVYWVQGGSAGTVDVVSVPRAGGPKVVLASPAGSGLAIAVDDTAIVWSTRASNGLNSGNLYLMAK